MTHDITKEQIRDWSNSNGLGYRADLHDMYESLFRSAYDMGAAHEREACAKVCEEDAFVEEWKGLAEAARRIRARGSV